ncbi:hypothetical protein BDM02DRAFT_900094 [Thelephora ganbajun]|uniref:Uncharacterized protein n=1 Tax=Thelephora ganbajun TaxID=370292 RepID=A0ACB6ZNV2_THEGA|nr:hypothetical protein BDM02DRAFT_900094 [Thelephora ganbajun]
MGRLVSGFIGFPTLWFRNAIDCVVRSHIVSQVLTSMLPAPQLVAFVSALPLGTGSLPSTEGTGTFSRDWKDANKVTESAGWFARLLTNTTRAMGAILNA